MTWPTAVNGQITDAVSQSAVSVLGQAGAVAVGSAAQSFACTAGLRAEAQQGGAARMAMIRQAVTAQAAAALIRF